MDKKITISLSTEEYDNIKEKLDCYELFTTNLQKIIDDVNEHTDLNLEIINNCKCKIIYNKDNVTESFNNKLDKVKLEKKRISN